MTVLESFATLQSVVDADVKVVQIARDRRDTFTSALLTAPDVKVVWGRVRSPAAPSCSRCMMWISWSSSIRTSTRTGARTGLCRRGDRALP